MTNYICINGKKAELTEEQMKLLGIELPKENPFARTKLQRPYYMITDDGNIFQSREMNDIYDKTRYHAANYCTDGKMMQQRAWHETLHRLLWRYSMEHGGNEINWSNPTTRKYRITYDRGEFRVMYSWFNVNIGCVHFTSKEIAADAIAAIIVPFMKDHPDFKW